MDMSGELVQGLGEGPAGFLGGTSDGCIQRWDLLEGRKPRKFEWKVGVRHGLHGPVWCLAATDQVVVTRFHNGDLGITTMDTLE